MSKKSEKLAARIAAMKSELTAAKAAEKEAAGEAARREIDRAVRASGLLGLVTSGVLSSEAIAREFCQVVERHKTAAPATPNDATVAPEATDKRGWFGVR